MTLTGGALLGISALDLLGHSRTSLRAVRVVHQPVLGPESPPFPAC